MVAKRNDIITANTLRHNSAVVSTVQEAVSIEVHEPAFESIVPDPTTIEQRSVHDAVKDTRKKYDVEASLASADSELDDSAILTDETETERD